MQMIESNNIKNRLKDETICHGNLSTIHLIYKISKTWKKIMTNFLDKSNTWFLNFKKSMKDGIVVVKWLKLEHVGGGVLDIRPWQIGNQCQVLQACKTNWHFPISLKHALKHGHYVTWLPNICPSFLVLLPFLVRYLVSLTIGLTRC